MPQLPTPAEGGSRAIHAAGLSVDDFDLETADRIRRAVSLANQAALAVKSHSESTFWKVGRFTGLPIAIYQNWLYEQNREWRFTDGTLCVLWCVEFPDARSDYAEKHHYIASTRREYNAGRHQADAPAVPSVAYERRVGVPVPATGLANTPQIQVTDSVKPAATEPPTREVTGGVSVTKSHGGGAAASPASRRFVITSDPERTKTRIARLDDYMARNILQGKDFVCSSYASCRSSHPGDFYEGQLHHVGAHYDVTLNGRPFRVVVVGQEYGNGPARVTRQARSRDIVVLTGREKHFRREGTHQGRNPHMRGTTSVLRLLFGRQLGADYAGELLEVDGKHLHAFEAFALVNFLLCSAIDARQGAVGSKRGKSTRIMQHNCARHFLEVLRILEPTIVVAQGQSVRRWMRSVVEPLASLSPTLERVALAGHECLLASFTHPSVPSRDNWGTDERRPYLHQVVAPTVRVVHNIVLGGA